MKLKLLILLIGMSFQMAFGQVEPSPFDFGKMWTFENPPKEWFKEAYDFDVDQAWFDDARNSSLRFASWCSASFVSPDGLVMTNHHCSQPVAPALQRDGEDFDKTGFYAPTQADERRSEGLFVEQLIRTADITEEVEMYIGKAENDADRLAKREEALNKIQEEYSNKSGWEGLRLQLVTYYSGGKFSIYGYKRYDDVRLVFLPELQLGFFGGDPDNFTYPRYNLDVTFWRVYENGRPLNTSENYFKFNPDGVKENEPVFVIGNPGTTERYRTVAQLEYDRDYRYPMQIAQFEMMMDLLSEEYEKNPNDDLQNQIFSISNSMKATQGTLDGLNDPHLFARKVAMEQKIRSAAGTENDYWTPLIKSYEELSGHVMELNFLQPNPLYGTVMNMLYPLNEYIQKAESGADEGELNQMEENILSVAGTLNTPDEKEKLAMVLSLMTQYADPTDTYLNDIMGGRSPAAAAEYIISESLLNDKDKLEKLFSKKPKRFLKQVDKDPIFHMARILPPMYNEAVSLFRSTSPQRRDLESKVANEVFKVYGSSLPPDATFTLRISDGRVKSYAYNGTEAPIMTTYFGMYDRHYSHGQKFPWSLPDKWKNPSMELLKSPINFINTCDIIGGNSGSPVINMNQEAVGLVFDGNIESLPGKFIFDEESNRTVAVHAGGIIAALKYVYNADRIANELLGM